MAMDQNKVEMIDRFVQSVSFHGPILVDLTREDQGDAEGAAMAFLAPGSRNLATANYFRNKLQVCCNERQQPGIARTLGDVMLPSYNQRVCKFIASKADLLFQVKGKQQRRRGVDYEIDSNHDVLDLYSKVPPLETFMGIPAHIRRWQILQLLKEGDIIIGEVSFKRPFGIFVELKALEFGKSRDFSGTDIQALCRTCELGNQERHREHKDPADAFVLGDHVRGVICSVSPEENKVTVSFKTSQLPPEHQDIHLGLIEDLENVKIGSSNDVEGTRYEEHLTGHMGFNNPRNVDTLMDVLGLDTDAPCSLLRSFQRCDYPEEDCADQLRKKQSAKWSMESTAKGIEHFKVGDVSTALKYLEHALQINAENVEALVARGALIANEGKYGSAVKDFRQALSISHNHKNALKYLVETLVEQGIREEKGGHLVEAASCFKEAYELDKDRPTVKQHLDKVRELLNIRHQRKESASSDKLTGQDQKSKFSHVRQLIKEEQVKRKKKRKEKKKRKKLKTEKMKKKRSKTRRRSRRSSTDESTTTASDESNESAEEEWVQKSVVRKVFHRTENDEEDARGHLMERTLSREEERQVFEIKAINKAGVGCAIDEESFCRNRNENELGSSHVEDSGQFYQEKERIGLPLSGVESSFPYEATWGNEKLEQCPVDLPGPNREILSRESEGRSGLPGREMPYEGDEVTSAMKLLVRNIRHEGSSHVTSSSIPRTERRPGPGKYQADVSVTGPMRSLESKQIQSYIPRSASTVHHGDINKTEIETETVMRQRRASEGSGSTAREMVIGLSEGKLPKTYSPGLWSSTVTKTKKLSLQETRRKRPRTRSKSSSASSSRQNSSNRRQTLRAHSRKSHDGTSPRKRRKCRSRGNSSSTSHSSLSSDYTTRKHTKTSRDRSRSRRRSRSYGRSSSCKHGKTRSSSSSNSSGTSRNSSSSDYTTRKHRKTSRDRSRSRWRSRSYDRSSAYKHGKTRSSSSSNSSGTSHSSSSSDYTTRKHSRKSRDGSRSRRRPQSYNKSSSRKRGKTLSSSPSTSRSSSSSDHTTRKHSKISRDRSRSRLRSRSYYRSSSRKHRKTRSSSSSRSPSNSSSSSRHRAMNPRVQRSRSRSYSSTKRRYRSEQ